MGRYLIKCDECKKTIGTSDNVIDSYSGGRCSNCRRKAFASIDKAINKGLRK